MTTEVRVTYEMNAEYLSKTLQEYGRSHPPLVAQYSAYWLYPSLAFILGLPFACWFIWRSHDVEPKWFVFAILLLPLLAAYLVIRSFRADVVAKVQLDTSQIEDRHISITVNKRGWFIESSLTRCENQWPVIQRVTRMVDGFVVTEDLNSVRWLPRTGFESDAAIDSFVCLVQGASIEYEDRRTLSPDTAT